MRRRVSGIDNSGSDTTLPRSSAAEVDTAWQLATFSKQSLRISPVIDTGAPAIAGQQAARNLQLFDKQERFTHATIKPGSSARSRYRVRGHSRYAPACIASGVLEDSGRSPTGSSADEEEARKILATRTPLGVPWIEPKDVAAVVVFLASHAARMVSGATYDVTAGDSARNTT
jgi:hypothetical protein